MTLIADDPDLAALPADRKRALARARLDNYSGQLYEALLNRATTEAAPGIDSATREQQITALDKQIGSLRASIALHRPEAAEPDQAAGITDS